MPGKRPGAGSLRHANGGQEIGVKLAAGNDQTGRTEGAMGRAVKAHKKSFSERRVQVAGFPHAERLANRNVQRILILRSRSYDLPGRKFEKVFIPLAIQDSA